MDILTSAHIFSQIFLTRKSRKTQKIFPQMAQMDTDFLTQKTRKTREKYIALQSLNDVFFLTQKAQKTQKEMIGN